jgi:hypothetical protein
MWHAHPARDFTAARNQSKCGTRILRVISRRDAISLNVARASARDFTAGRNQFKRGTRILRVTSRAGRPCHFQMPHPDFVTFSCRKPQLMGSTESKQSSCKICLEGEEGSCYAEAIKSPNAIRDEAIEDKRTSYVQRAFFAVFFGPRSFSIAT